ncbi:MAG: hypothetical protein ACTSP9_06545 [Promethearchaeota archaeon]
MAISLNMTIPASSWYQNTGSQTITIHGANNFIMNTKKSLIKIQVPQSAATIASNPTDQAKNYVKDLKRVEDTMKIRGWLIDTTNSSAWEQAWQLRGMCASGGPITELIVDNLTFSSATQTAFLEEVNFVVNPTRTLQLDIADTSSASMNTARVEVDLAFYLGDER